MRSPRESFEDIAKHLEEAHDAWELIPREALQAEPRLYDILGGIVSAHTSAILQASSLKKREKAGELFAMPVPTETVQ